MNHPSPSWEGESQGEGGGLLLTLDQGEKGET
jgi:hypothetical protein